jgi:hypothetical protein
MSREDEEQTAFITVDDLFYYVSILMILRMFFLLLCVLCIRHSVTSLET